MITFLNIIRILCLVFMVFYAYVFIIKNNENIMPLFIGILIIIISTFLISMINYKTNIQPFFTENNFIKIQNLKNIKKELIKSDEINIDYAFYKDNLSILKLNLNDIIHNSNNKQEKINIFKGIYIRKENVNSKPFSIANNSKIKKFLGIKLDITTIDNVEFNKYFKLYTDNKIATFKYLDPFKLEFISTKAKMLNHKISLFYKNDTLHFYIHNFNFSKNIKNEYETILNIINEF
ncbi:DUF3137 domain-containing protein [Campylobacter sp. MG1]|uniref:DUF3137 domain-containing protein n=1 Tax=Campylobacter sp. MG1 TaxID=2976332 RepID=UPI00226CDD83|nr:DUF3137 domain-containing protein [Campylobacter sp. MG1]